MNIEQEVPSGAVVAAVDGSEASYDALRWAAEQADLEERDLAIVHVFGMTATAAMADFGGAAMYRAIEENGHAVLEAAVGRVAEAVPGLQPHAVLLAGDPRSVLLEACPDLHLLVVGARGRGPVERLVLGSVSSTVARHADCPVVIERGGRTEPGRGVLVGVESPESSRPEVEFAFGIAAVRRLPVTVLHAYFAVGEHSARPDAPDVAELHRQLDEAVEGIADRYPEVTVEKELRRGFVDRELVGASHGTDLVVVRRHPNRSILGLLDPSVAGTVVKRATGAVAVVPE